MKLIPRESKNVNTFYFRNYTFFKFSSIIICSPTYQQNRTSTQKKDKPNFESKNRFEILRDDNTNSKNSKQAFHKEDPGDTITLKDLMKELMAIKARQDLQEKKQTLESDNQDWRNPRSQSRKSKSQRNPY